MVYIGSACEVSSDLTIVFWPKRGLEQQVVKRPVLGVKKSSSLKPFFWTFYPHSRPAAFTHLFDCFMDERFVQVGEGFIMWTLLLFNRIVAKRASTAAKSDIEMKSTGKNTNKIESLVESRACCPSCWCCCWACWGFFCRYKLLTTRTYSPVPLNAAYNGHSTRNSCTPSFSDKQVVLTPRNEPKTGLVWVV